MRMMVAAVLTGLAACAPASPGNDTAAVDAAPVEVNETTPVASAPVAALVSAAPRPAAAPRPVAAPDDAPIDEAAAATAVVARYYALIADRRYADAWALWRRQGAASGMTADAFAASFDRYASYRATIGAPFDADAGAGQRYISVPVTIRGTLKSGGPFMLDGPLHLHKVADGIESDDPSAHEWRIDTSAIRPRPDLVGQKAR